MENDFIEGYWDGRDKDCPPPSDNRSESYKHSFDVGRRELENKVLPADLYRIRAQQAEDKDNDQ